MIADSVSFFLCHFAMRQPSLTNDLRKSAILLGVSEEDSLAFFRPLPSLPRYVK